MTLTALIADDEEHLRHHLRARLAAVWPELTVIAEAANGVEAASRIAELAPSVVFLDIRMPGMSGLEVAQGIEVDTRVVFVTAYDQYAVEAFEREAVDYLVKPVTEERLARTADRLRKALGESTPPPGLARLLQQLMQRQGAAAAGGERALRWVRASRGETVVHVPVQEVLYFQSDDKYTVVRTCDGEHLIRTPLTELATSLDPEWFWQIHRSTIVNMQHVAATRRDDGGRLFVRFRDHDAELPVSRAYVHLFRQM